MSILINNFLEVSTHPLARQLKNYYNNPVLINYLTE
jgi:hypothetical protein